MGKDGALCWLISSGLAIVQLCIGLVALMCAVVASIFIVASVFIDCIGDLDWTESVNCGRATWSNPVALAICIYALDI